MKKTTAFLLCTILTGCTVGPKYQRSAAGDPDEPAGKCSGHSGPSCSGQPARQPGAGRRKLDRGSTRRCQDSRGLVGRLQ
jgi:hypothetical protein